MSEATRSPAFEEFYTTKPAGKGSGLGLALCKNLVETSGGSIRLDSREGAGNRRHHRAAWLGSSGPPPETGSGSHACAGHR